MMHHNIENVRRFSGYHVAQLVGKNAPDIDFHSLGSAMDCTRAFSQAGIIYASGYERYLVRPGRRFPTKPVQLELVKQLSQLVTSAAALTGSATSGIMATPGNVPHSGRYIIGTIQSLAVF